MKHSIIQSIALVSLFTTAVGGATSSALTSTNKAKSEGASTSSKLVARSIASGFGHTCVVLSNGMIQCWGDNQAGQLGNGSELVGGSDRQSNKPVPVAGITNAVAVAAGEAHTCALLRSRAVYCWGQNTWHQLGQPNWPKSWVALPVVVPGITNAAAISAGSRHSCAVLSDATVQCWGGNRQGQLGNGTKTDFTAPGPVSSINGKETTSTVPVTDFGIANVAAIAAGYNHNCALLRSGKVHCWGDNSVGQLGNGTWIDSSVPASDCGITNVVAISAGSNYNCVVLRDSTVWCWGYSQYGALGNGSTFDRGWPVQVSGITNGVAVAAGYGHVCALLRSGNVQCWGINTYGQLGNGSTTAFSSVPVTVSGISARAKIMEPSKAIWAANQALVVAQ